MTAVNIDELCSSGVKIDRKQKRERRRRNYHSLWIFKTFVGKKISFFAEQ